MNDVKFMLKLIAATVYTKQYPLPEKSTSWDNIFAISSMHGIANIIAHAVAEGGYEVSAEIKERLKIALLKSVTVCENQILELNKLFSEFEKSKVDYMPLKGTVIRELYPTPDMRSMADADILVHSFDIEKLNSIMHGLGYAFDGESNHEYNYTKKPFVHIELHKYLIPSYNDDLYAYYGDGWKLAKRTSPEDCRFELSVEDHFIYLITHFAKHYRDAGAGIKSVIDIWLYKKKHTEMDMKYVKAQLKRLKLSNFADNVFRMAGVWFDDEKEDNLTSRMSAFVIKSTAFGTYENQVLAKTIREYQDKDIGKAVKYRYLDALFPKLEHMKQIYPVLNKMSVLLPVFWLIRIFQRTFWGEKTVSEYKRKVDILENDNIADFKKHIKEVGLDIYNGRNKE